MREAYTGAAMSMGRSEALYREYWNAARARSEAEKLHGLHSMEYSRASAELDAILFKMTPPLGRLGRQM